MARAAPFGRTWWGQAWVDALERAGALDPSRLSRGRSYARNGSVQTLDLAPGHVSARVTGKHGRFYRTDVAVRPLAHVEWEQVAEAIAARAGHAAALLDGELDPGIVADAAECDIRLLPGPGDLRPDCSCPDWAEPCKHAAALCYLVAAELDRDPFVLFLLRGMGREDLLAMVRARRSSAPRPDGELSAESLGVDATDAFERLPLDEPLPPLPEEVAAALRHLGPAPVAPPRWEVQLPANLGVDPRAVEELGADASSRAWAMLAEGADSGIRLGNVEDLARRAAGMDAAARRDLARSLGWHPSRLDARVDAWRVGGAIGVRMLEEDDLWSTDQQALSAGREVLVEAGWSRRQVSLNYDSLRMKGAVWLALGPDRRWYRFAERGQRQELHLTDPPTDDLAGLVGPPPNPPTR